MKTLHSRNLDDALRDFYRSEMPAPWPVLEAPAPATIPAKKPQHVRFRAVSRLALASLFPRDSGARPGLTPVSDGISQKDGKSSKPKLDLIPKGFILSEPQR